MINNYFQGEDGEIFYQFRNGAHMILYLHGYMGNITIFNKQRRFLSQRGFGEIAPDLRGSGKSFKPDNKESYQIEKFVSDIEQLLDYKGIEKFSIIAHSMGTLIAQALTAKNLENVEKLILISSLFSIREAWSWRYKLLTSLSPLIKISRQILETFGKENSNKKYQPDMGEERSTFEELKQNLLHFRYFGITPLLLADALSEWDTKGAAQEISVPTLLIHGENDSLIPQRSAHKLKELIPNSKIEVLKGGHVLQVKNSGEVNSKIGDFLERNVE